MAGFGPNLMSAEELARIRADVTNGVMPGTCLIIPQVVSNVKGVQSQADGTAVSSVCRFYADQRENSRSYTAGDVMATMTEWILTLPHNAVVHNGWIVEYEGTRYEVVGVYDDPSYKVAIRADLVRLHLDDPLG